jgi:hypothetical protein
MSALLRLSLFNLAGLVLWPLDSYFFMRLAQKSNYRRPWIAWVPFFRTHIVATAAGLGWASWLLSQVPLIGLYVQWDWWDEIGDEVKFGHPGWRAWGIVLVPGLRTYLIYRTVQKYVFTTKYALVRSLAPPTGDGRAPAELGSITTRSSAH